ncbi:MAG: beta-1,6-N-acetylglucosaminyltransferase [Candidatus Azobacteroides sp.]|nr:beta-1,6-N-acetylglucosaminyltransferase [Candidatus Azobacteroides sp.]
MLSKKKEQKIAYLIEAHNDVENLKRLVEQLNFNADFFIHIDKKTNIEPFLREINLSNLFFIDKGKRIKVFWGGISQVRAILLMMNEVIAKNYNYKKVVLLSGADYPIKSNSYIHSFFDKYKYVNFIRGMNITKANHPKYNQCICKYHFFNFSFINKEITRGVRKILYIVVNYFFSKRNFINIDKYTLDIFHGSSWWALNMDFLIYVMENKKLRRSMDAYFRYSLASDEKFFHTIFFNSQYANTNTEGGGEPFYPATSKFANLHIIDQSLQKYFTIEDFEYIRNSDKLFVRKVSTEKSTELLNKIDECLLR